MPLVHVGNTTIEHHPRPEDERFIDTHAIDPEKGLVPFRVLADILEPNLTREFCLLLGGTLVSIELEGGARPGMGIPELLGKESDVRFTWDKFGQAPRMVLPLPESPYYFGPPQDSSQLQPEHFARVAEICHALCNDCRIHRITIITGTDTAEYLAAALARMLSHPNKPILILAAMRTPSAENSDALPNFHMGRYFNAHLDPGIYLYLDQDAHDARRVTKAHSVNTNAFRSLGAEPVATFRHDFHPFLGIGLNYLSRDTLAHHLTLLAEMEAVWDWCQRTKLAHDYYRVNFHLYEPDQKEQALAEQRRSIEAELEHFSKLNMLPSPLELRFPPTPQLITKFDNAVYCERITPGYRASWLRELLTRDDVHAVFLTGLEEVTSELCGELLPLIETFSRYKPVITFEDADGRDNAATRRFHRLAEQHGAIPSGGVSLAFGTITLKWLLAQGLDQTDLRTAWKFSEYTGGPGYIAARKPAIGKTQPLKIELSTPIRYVHLIPGYEPQWLEAILEDSQTKAVVIGAFGTGNIPFEGSRELLSLLKDHAARIPIVIRTQCAEGPTDLDAYQPGVEAQKAGVLSAGNRTLEETLLELDFLLANNFHVQRDWGTLAVPSSASASPKSGPR